jgi:anti-sigma regulatory factor (Ser/Thr protein kinase)
MNAIEHGHGRTEFEVDAAISGDAVDVTVRDQGHWRSPRPANPGGRGLDMMRELMDAVEVTPADDGTLVRMRRSVKREVPS